MTKKGPLPKEWPQEREARLAEALRANLRKRKEQQRAREDGKPGEKPVESDAFAALMEPLNVKGARLAVAVSGGPDSMALAWCLKRWATAHNRAVTALIVDHQLRPESGEEAATVRERLETLGIETVLLRWEHEPVVSRMHVEARKARYDLLLEACRQRGIADLFLAHQREDQAETILMRFAKGSGIDGLAGMAHVTVRDGVRLLRPFLGTSKERLIATCAAAGLVAVADPSNEKTLYARGRLRQVMPLLADEGMTVDRLLDLGERAREARAALNDAAGKLLRVAVRMDQAGVLAVDLEHLRAAPRAIVLRVLGACMQSMHKAAYPPERSSLLSLLEGLVSDAPMGARTLHGCRVGKGDRTATLIREYGAIADVQPIAAGKTVVWDGRWEVRLASAQTGTNLVVRALGAMQHDALDRLAPGLRKRCSKGHALAVLPALWEGDKVILVPDLTGSMDALCRAAVISWPEMYLSIEKEENFVTSGHCI